MVQATTVQQPLHSLRRLFSGPSHIRRRRHRHDGEGAVAVAVDGQVRWKQQTFTCVDVEAATWQEVQGAFATWKHRFQENPSLNQPLNRP